MRVTRLFSGGNFLSRINAGRQSGDFFGSFSLRQLPAYQHFFLVHPWINRGLIFIGFF